MLYCSLQTIDKLDIVEEKEVYKKEEAKLQAPTPTISNNILGNLSSNPLNYTRVAFNPKLSILPSFQDLIDISSKTSLKGLDS